MRPQISRRWIWNPNCSCDGNLFSHLNISWIIQPGCPFPVTFWIVNTTRQPLAKSIANWYRCLVFCQILGGWWCQKPRWGPPNFPMESPTEIFQHWKLTHASGDAFNDAYNSDSHGDKTINVCVWPQPLTHWLPIFTHPPVVGLRVSLQFAQSASPYATKLFGIACHLGCNINLGLPSKYFANLLNRCKSPRTGLDITPTNSLIANEISNLSGDKSLHPANVALNSVASFSNDTPWSSLFFPRLWPLGSPLA